MESSTSKTIAKVESSGIEAKEELEPWKMCYSDMIPEKIPVIVAKKSPSNYAGTFLKHPNQDNFYLLNINIAETLDLNDPKRDELFF